MAMTREEKNDVFCKEFVKRVELKPDMTQAVVAILQLSLLEVVIPLVMAQAIAEDVEGKSPNHIGGEILDAYKLMYEYVSETMAVFNLHLPDEGEVT